MKVKSSSKNRSSSKHSFSQHTASSRNALIDQYQTYAKNVVGYMCEIMNLPKEHFDEYLAAAYLGLVEAAERFDGGTGRDFKNYAYLRIRGAVIDSIREISDLSGRAYRYSKALRSVHDLREVLFEEQRRDSKKGKNTESLLSDFLEFAAKGALAFRLSSADAEAELAGVADYKRTPEQVLEYRDQVRELREVIASMPEKERLVLEEYYFNEKSFADIVQENEGMSKSWVSRLHSRALEMLKEKYNEIVAANQ